MSKKRVSLLEKILAKETWRAGGVEWVVTFVERVDEEGSCGACRDATQIIEIRNDMSPEIKIKTLFHELGHAVGDSDEGWSTLFELMTAVLLDNDVLSWKI